MPLTVRFSPRRLASVVAAVALLPVLAVAAAQGPARAAVPKVIGTNVLLDGRGFGHGRGMSQFGSFGYAVDHGWTWQQILGHYYGGTTLDPGFGNPEVGVRLLAMDGRPFTAAVRPAGGIQVNATGATYTSVVAFQVGPGIFALYGKNTIDCPADDTPKAAFDDMTTNGWIALNPSSATAEFAVPGVDTNAVTADQLIGLCQPTTHTVSDQPKGGVQLYRGRLFVTTDAGVTRTVAISTLDSYLRGVVPSESPANWGTAGGGKGENALYAQAVAARSYAMSAHRYPYADVCDTQACQVYRGAAYRNLPTDVTFSSREQTTTNTAVAGTSGVVLRMANGTVAVAEFSSSSGGWTAGGTFPAVEDLGDATASNPNNRWATPAVIPSSQVAAVYPQIGSLLDIQILQRNGLGEWGGRVLSMKVLGTAGTVTVTGDQFRSAFGLKSNWFNISASCVGRVPPPLAAPTTPVAAPFTPVSPTRIVDTRLGTGTQTLAVGAGCTMPVNVLGAAGVPASGVTAVALNVTATRAVQSGFLTVYPCGVGQPDASNVNYAPGIDRANMVTARVGVGGQVCIYTSAEVDVIVDVLGAYGSAGSAPYEPVVPARVFDSRFAGTANPGTERAIALAGQVPPAATAVVLNLTATRTTANGFAKFYPCGEVPPDVSNVNFVDGRDVANQAVVKLGASQQVCAVTSARADLVVDLLGWFGPGATRRFVPANPQRLLDTRLGTGAPVAPVAKGATVRLPVSPTAAPAGAVAASLNVTAADAAGAGFVIVHPCTVPPPNTSNLNFRSGEAVANLSTVPLASDGAVCMTTSVTTNLIADLNGWYV
jgi:SpoIID/LytB domain protein